MSAATAVKHDRAREMTTLQDLVLAVPDVTASDRESVAAMTHLLADRRAMLVDGRPIRVRPGWSR